MSDYKPSERDLTLAFIVQNPALIEGLKIPDEFFRDHEQRTVWTAIQELRKAERPVSLVSIVEHTGNGSAGYLNDITSVVMPIKLEDLQRRVHLGAIEDLQKRRRSLSGANCPDEDEIASLSEAIRRLQIEVEEGLAPEPQSAARQAFIGSLQGFLTADIQAAEPLIEGLIGREEFLYVGGVKHSHKTSLLMGLALSFAAGKSPWLNFRIPKPGRVLMVQQELGEYEFKKRLQAALSFGGFDISVRDRFFTFTGTGDPIKIMTDKGFARLEALVKQFSPDILALDPQASFCVGKENDDVAQAHLRDRINILKTKYKMGVVLSHHFSSKRPAGDLNAPTELAGWFRGHTVLSDAADAQFGLHRLPGQRTNPNLPRAYENYNQVEINLRNGKWPPKFSIEFDEQAFLMKMSNVWQEAGFRIPVGNVREVCDAHGGSILLAELVTYYIAQLGEISAPAVRSAVNRDVAAGLVATEKVKGKGSPILVKATERKV